MATMRKTALLGAGVALATLGLFAVPAFAAAPPPAAPPAAVSAVSGWDALIDRLRDLPDRMLARLPEAQRADPQVRQEMGRLALEALISSGLDTLAADPDRPVFVTQIGPVLNVGQPNADTIYRTARLTPGGTYRLRGLRGSLRMVRLQESDPAPGEPGFDPAKRQGQRVAHDLNALKVDADGRYDVILSPVRPAGHTGDWWPLRPTTSRLLLRMVSSDWAREVAPTIAIERVDAPATRPRPSAAFLEERLRMLPRATDFIALLFVDHVAKLRAEGYVNRLKVPDFVALGGLQGQFYYEGAYDLKDDEALIVEAKVPAKCLYHSLILTNDLYETTDWVNNHSSLSDSQSRVDKDGVLRIIVSAKDPGVPNWLDTAGYPTGVIQGRWTECDSQPVPSVRKVKLGEVRKALPADTPTVSAAERDRSLRDRRAAYQQRPQW